MKATTILISAVLSLQVNILFAGNDLPLKVKNNDASASYCVSLAPTAPKEATFEDDATLTDYAWLAPVAPKEATFEDDADSIDAGILQSLAPVAP
jgi:hypothetical protein